MHEDHKLIHKDIKIDNIVVDQDFQPHIIDFLKVTDWVDFLIEYHKDSKEWVRLLPAAIPEFPVFNAKFDPKTIPPCGHDKPGGTPGKPDRPTAGKR